jgi:predicted transcriptional regulator
MKPETIKAEKKSWALPGEPLTLAEFKEGIKKAEEGPFMTIEEVKRKVEKWKKEQNL